MKDNCSGDQRLLGEVILFPSSLVKMTNLAARKVIPSNPIL